MLCSQCGRPAFREVQGHPLCVDHWERVQRIQQQHIASLELERNNALFDMAYVTGDESLFARALVERKALERTTHVRNTTNVNVSNSTVGAINTGTIHTLNVRLKDLSQNQATAELATAFRSLAAAVLASQLSPQARNDAAAQMAFLAEQASVPVTERQAGLIRPILQAIQTAMSTTADLLAVWNQWGPLITAYFAS